MKTTLILAVAAAMLPFAMVSHAPITTASCASSGPASEQSAAAVGTKAEALGVEADPALAQSGGHTVLSNSGKGCGHGIRPCDASQVGQPCNPSNPGVICSAQANGSYCCLAYAP